MSLTPDEKEPNSFANQTDSSTRPRRLWLSAVLLAALVVTVNAWTTRHLGWGIENAFGNVLLPPAGTRSQAPASISGQMTANMGPPNHFGGYTHVVISALQKDYAGQFDSACDNSTGFAILIHAKNLCYQQQQLPA